MKFTKKYIISLNKKIGIYKKKSLHKLTLCQRLVQKLKTCMNV